MFTLQQIQEAHSKVRSGADFPAYIQEIRQLGIIRYQTVVTDGHADYYGVNDYKTTSPQKHEPLTIADECRKKTFLTQLKKHQQGKTDYRTFIRISAGLGIEKWVVDTEKMTCTYYDKAGNEVLTEEIPS